MELGKFVLVIVVIRRAKNDTAHAALADERINSLGCFRSRFFSLIERAEMFL